MSRVKGGTVTHARHKKIIKAAKISTDTYMLMELYTYTESNAIVSIKVITKV